MFRTAGEDISPEIFRGAMFLESMTIFIFIIIKHIQSKAWK